MTENEIQKLLEGTPLSFNCPTCSAKAFKGCRAPTGKVYASGFIHSNRKRAAGLSVNWAWGDSGIPNVDHSLLSVPCNKCGACIGENCRTGRERQRIYKRVHAIRRTHVIMASD